MTTALPGSLKHDFQWRNFGIDLSSLCDRRILLRSRESVTAMYLHRIQASNFRVFGDGRKAQALSWELDRGLNVLVGENDAGKTAIIDAIRHVLLTTSYESFRLLEQDFHIEGSDRADTLTIEATLKDLSDDQEASVLEWLTYEADGTRSLILNLQARLRRPIPHKRVRVETLVRSGKGGTGPEIGFAVRELVRATYLKPLRDAEAELRPGRMSRLSQIIGAHPKMSGQETSDFDPKQPHLVPTTLVGLMEHAQYQIGNHDVISAVRDDINSNYLSDMDLANDNLTAEIRFGGEPSLTPILERLELALLPPRHIARNERCPRGLGYNNALFMASELVLLRDGDELGLLLVEEPEAHLHPQLQTRVMELLERYSKRAECPVQVVLSTHSPNLVSNMDIESMTLTKEGRTYRLSRDSTRLSGGDYEFLRRFLDATKSNLFFARGVIIVEGPAEALLLPAIAEMVGKPLSRYGVSIVNVGGIGLYHYARILQRKADGDTVQIPVACITDRDIVPNCAAAESTGGFVPKPKKGKRFESQYSHDEIMATVKKKKDRVEDANNPNVKVFVSDHWTLEYDLALAGLAKLIFIAIRLAEESGSSIDGLTNLQEKDITTKAESDWKTLQAEGLSGAELAARVYQPMYEKTVSKPQTAQYAARLLQSGDYGSGETLMNLLPEYLRSALLHVTDD